MVEVLTALAVLAIALAAALSAIGQGIHLTVSLRDRALALWVAEERAVAHRLHPEWPAINTTEGTLEMGAREWRWRERVSQTPVDDLRRIDIEVFADKTPDALANLAIFLQKPQ